MPQESRKATDVLLEVESKVNTLLDIIRAQDLNIKILSNKLNDVITKLNQQQAIPPKITVEAVQTVPSPMMPTGFTQLPPGDPDRNIPIVAESKLPQTEAPQGFRRTSRPETFNNKKPHLEGDGAYLNKKDSSDEVKMPIQMPPVPPGRSAADTKFPTYNSDNKKVPTDSSVNEARPTQEPKHMVQGQIPTMQRVVNKNGNAIFLANVEITDLSTGQSVFKTRTNGAGKWMASLGIGAYRVTISKRASASTNKEKLEAEQDIQVDGSQKPFELPMLIIK